MREIFFKELAYYLKDARLYLGFVFIVLTMGVGGLLYGRHYVDSISEYSKTVAVEDEKVRDLSYRLAELAVVHGASILNIPHDPCYIHVGALYWPDLVNYRCPGTIDIHDINIIIA